MATKRTTKTAAKRKKEVEVLPPEIEADAQEDKEKIEDAVKFINEKSNEYVYKGSIEIGEYLLKHFFDDDIEKASSRNPFKPVNYKALCKRDDLAVHPATLSVMVRVAAQEQYFESKDIDIKQLSYTHKAELVKIDNNEEKLKLVQECIDKSLTTRQLSGKIKEIRQVSKDDKEVEPLKEITRYSNKVEKLFDSLKGSELVFDEEKLESISMNRLEKLRLKSLDISDKLKKAYDEYQSYVDMIEKVKEHKKQSDK